MPYKRVTKYAVETIGADEVDGIPVAVGQNNSAGFFDLHPLDTSPHPDLVRMAKYEPSLNNSIKYVEEHGWCEPWPALPRNTLNRR